MREDITIKIKEYDAKGILVEGDYHFYNRVGFKTSSEFNIYPTSGIPMKNPKCMMCQETSNGSLKNIRGYVVYDMYYNALILIDRIYSVFYLLYIQY